MQAMKPITGIQVPSEKICAMLTPIADNSSIPVSVRYTCIHMPPMKSLQVLQQSTRARLLIPQTFSRWACTLGDLHKSNNRVRTVGENDKVAVCRGLHVGELECTVETEALRPSSESVHIVHNCCTGVFKA